MLYSKSLHSARSLRNQRITLVALRCQNMIPFRMRPSFDVEFLEISRRTYMRQPYNEICLIQDKSAPSSRMQVYTQYLTVDKFYDYVVALRSSQNRPFFSRDFLKYHTRNLHTDIYNEGLRESRNVDHNVNHDGHYMQLANHRDYCPPSRTASGLSFVFFALFTQPSGYFSDISLGLLCHSTMDPQCFRKN